MKKAVVHAVVGPRGFADVSMMSSTSCSPTGGAKGYWVTDRWVRSKSTLVNNESTVNGQWSTVTVTNMWAWYADVSS